jgi:hypothetical protein
MLPSRAQEQKEGARSSRRPSLPIRGAWHQSVSQGVKPRRRQHPYGRVMVGDGSQTNATRAVTLHSPGPHPGRPVVSATPWPLRSRYQGKSGVGRTTRKLSKYEDGVSFVCSPSYLGADSIASVCVTVCSTSAEGLQPASGNGSSPVPNKREAVGTLPSHGDGDIDRDRCSTWAARR